ncbi:LCP family protein [Streptomyces sp. NPDC088197]|uniref:LCP family protein n=1 Tax=Streptomyces sp. NPDC088197 TaxID=3365840 RepID=UPI00380353E4
MTTPAEPPQGDSVPPASDGSDDASGTQKARSDEPAEPTTEAEAEPEAEAETETEAEAEAEPEAETEADADAGTEPGADTEKAAEPAADTETDTPPVEGPAAAPAEEPANPKNWRWLKVVALCTAVLVLACAGTGWYLYQRLNGNITTDTATENDLKVHASERPTQGPTEAQNILLIGSDNRGNGNSKYGQDSGTQRSDTTILLHISADRKSATAVSLPRDLMTHVPRCTLPSGKEDHERFEQFNWAFESGGAACTIRTVEKMTGIRVDHHLIVDFNGFKKMVGAVNGVDVCLAEPVHDTYAHLDLPAGRQTLNGEQALGYVRARHGIGDGSDTMRMDRQQAFLASLLKKVSSNGVLLNPTKLYPLLSAATSSLTADPGLDSLSELYTLAHSLQQIPTGNVHFLTVPREQYVNDINRDQLVQPAADTLFKTLRDDRPVNVSDKAPDSGDGGGDSAGGTRTPGTPSAGSTSTATPTTTPTGPTYRGTTADRDICGKSG